MFVSDSTKSLFLQSCMPSNCLFALVDMLPCYYLCTITSLNMMDFTACILAWSIRLIRADSNNSSSLDQSNSEMWHKKVVLTWPEMPLVLVHPCHLLVSHLQSSLTLRKRFLSRIWQQQKTRDFFIPRTAVGFPSFLNPIIVKQICLKMFHRCYSLAAVTTHLRVVAGTSVRQHSGDKW